MRMYYRTGATGKPQAVIVDMDGTLVDTSSLHDLLRSIVRPDGTWSKEGLDEFHLQSSQCPALWETVDRCSGWWSKGVDVVIMTARDVKYRNQTKNWLHRYGVPYAALYMRAGGDARSDYDVKKDLLTEVREHWDVVYAIDDNPSIIRLWDEEGIENFRVPGWIEV